MQEKIITMIEFALRAGKISLGETSIYRGAAGKVKLALLATDASESSKKKYSDKLSYYKVPYLELGSKKELGEIVGKNEVALLAIEDINIAKQVIKLVKGGD